MSTETQAADPKTVAKGPENTTVSPEKQKEQVKNESRDNRAELMLGVVLTSVFNLLGVNMLGTADQQKNGEESFLARIVRWFKGEPEPTQATPSASPAVSETQVKSSLAVLREASARKDFPEIYALAAVLLNTLPKRGSDLVVFPAALKSQGKEILRIQGEPYINASAALDLIALASRYRQQTNKPLIIASGFRTTSSQEAIYRRRGGAKQRGGRYAAPPGQSNHNTGHAIDVDNASYNSYPGGLDAFEELSSQFGFNALERSKRNELKEFGHLNHITSISKDLRSGVAQELTNVVEKHDHT